jgi:hypothetical protein
MTSVLNVDTIADKAGTGPVGLTKQAAAKAFAHAGSSGNSLGSSLNVSSLADEATGLYSITFTNTMSAVPAANYSDALSIGYNNDAATASVVKSQSYASNFTAADSANVYYSVHGDLA